MIGIDLEVVSGCWSIVDMRQTRRVVEISRCHVDAKVAPLYYLRTLMRLPSTSPDHLYYAVKSARHVTSISSASGYRPKPDANKLAIRGLYRRTGMHYLAFLISIGVSYHKDVKIHDYFGMLPAGYELMLHARWHMSTLLDAISWIFRTRHTL